MNQPNNKGTEVKMLVNCCFKDVIYAKKKKISQCLIKLC